MGRGSSARESTRLKTGVSVVQIHPAAFYGPFGLEWKPDRHLCSDEVGGDERDA